MASGVKRQVISLRGARDQGKLGDFIAERQSDAPGDQAAFDATLKAMAGRSKEAPTALKPECGDD